MTWGCSNKSDGDSAVGAGNGDTPPAAYTSNKASMTPDQFIAKMNGMSRDDRAAFISANSATVNQIMAMPDGSPDKEKLTAIINQH
jgi:hypothetical protein